MLSSFVVNLNFSSISLGLKLVNLKKKRNIKQLNNKYRKNDVLKII